ncbi:VWA domain-containing protein [Gemmata sp.]|uniref:VWA domain-containing protein n=1 Tax=Gemmata sp. TaxID=1914242 RepID=UPI003F6F09C1
MSTEQEQRTPGGIVHTYQRYDPVNFPSPTAPPPDMVSPLMEHVLQFGDGDEFTEEQLANAIRLDASQIAGLGPSLNAIRQMLLERKRKILETYETKHVKKLAANEFRDAAQKVSPPAKLDKAYQRAVKQEQLADLEALYFQANDDTSRFARELVIVVGLLGEKYQVDELASKYEFTGREKMDVPKALEVKEELETIDKLLKQLEDAKKTAQLAIIDMEDLEKFAEPGDMEKLSALQQQIEDYIKEQAEKQGLEGDGKGKYRLTPKALRLFQSKVLTKIFGDLQASRTGRHPDAVAGEGAVESPKTKPYEFGDSVAQMDIPASMTNALLRSGPGLPVRMTPDDIVIHRTRVNPKAATCVLLDMSGSMRYDSQYVNVKRMGLALEGLIRSEYPGDFLQFVEMYTFAKPRHVSEVAGLMPKPVTIFSPVVRLKADMSNPDVSEVRIPSHFTNIQHALQTARRYLAAQDTPNRQVVLITDGLPTAHFEGSTLFMLYPPDPRTEEATMREALLCAREGITINIFLLSNWNQSEEDVRFAYRIAESTKGRVVFTAGRDLDRYVIWDYIKRRKQIVS